MTGQGRGTTSAQEWDRKQTVDCGCSDPGGTDSCLRVRPQSYSKLRISYPFSASCETSRGIIRSCRSILITEQDAANLQADSLAESFCAELA